MSASGPARLISIDEAIAKEVWDILLENQRLDLAEILTRALRDSAILTNEPHLDVPNVDAIIAYLDFLTGDRARQKEVLAGLKHINDAYETITDDVEQGMAGENRRMAEAWLKMVEAKREQIKAPWLTGGRAVDAYFKKLSFPVDTALTPVIRKMNEYNAAKEKRERENARILARRAQEAAEKAAAEAAAALVRAPETAGQALDDAARLSKVAAQATEHAEGRPAALTRTRGPIGAVVSSRRTWKFKVTDMRKLPWVYLMPDMAAIEQAGRIGARAPDGKPLTEIAGGEWVAEDRTSVR